MVFICLAFVLSVCVLLIVKVHTVFVLHVLLIFCDNYVRDMKLVYGTWRVRERRLAL
jgi:hypothetical protein